MDRRTAWLRRIAVVGYFVIPRLAIMISGSKVASAESMTISTMAHRAHSVL